MVGVGPAFEMLCTPREMQLTMFRNIHPIFSRHSDVTVTSQIEKFDIEYSQLSKCFSTRFSKLGFGENAWKDRASGLRLVGVVVDDLTRESGTYGSYMVLR